MIGIEWERYGKLSTELDRSELEQYQHLRGIEFPKTYVEFLAEHMGMIADNAEVPIQEMRFVAGFVLGFEPGCVESPDDFFYSVPYRYSVMVDNDFPELLVPFIECPNGDLAFDFRSVKVDPPVVFVMQGFEPDEAVVNLSENFDAFLESGLVLAGS